MFGDRVLSVYAKAPKRPASSSGTSEEEEEEPTTRRVAATRAKVAALVTEDDDDDDNAVRSRNKPAVAAKKIAEAAHIRKVLLDDDLAANGRASLEALEKRFEEKCLRVAIKIEADRKRAMAADMHAYKTQMESMQQAYKTQMESMKQAYKTQMESMMREHTGKMNAAVAQALANIKKPHNDTAHNDAPHNDAPGFSFSSLSSVIPDMFRGATESRRASSSSSSDHYSSGDEPVTTAKKTATVTTAKKTASRRKKVEGSDEDEVKPVHGHNLRSRGKPPKTSADISGNNSVMTMLMDEPPIQARVVIEDDDDDLGGWGSDVSDTLASTAAVAATTNGGDDGDGEGMHETVHKLILVMQELPTPTHDLLDELWVSLSNINLDGPTRADIEDVHDRQAALLRILIVLHDGVSEEAMRRRVSPNELYAIHFCAPAPEPGISITATVEVAGDAI